MKSLNISLIGDKIEKNLNEQYRSDMADTAMMKIANLIMQNGDNFNLVSHYTSKKSDGRNYGKCFIDIGHESLYMFLDFYSTTGNSGGQTLITSLGLCNKTDVDTESYIFKTTIGGFQVLQQSEIIDGIKYYWGTINSTFWYMLDDNDKLSVIFGLADVVTNSMFILFDKDIFGKKYFLYVYPFNEGSGNALYFYDDTTKYTIDTRRLKFSTDLHVLKERVGIILNNYTVSLTGALVKMYNESLGTNSQSTGTLIDVDGVKYRKMNYAYWLPDYDE